MSRRVHVFEFKPHQGESKSEYLLADLTFINHLTRTDIFGRKKNEEVYTTDTGLPENAFRELAKDETVRPGDETSSRPEGGDSLIPRAWVC